MSVGEFVALGPQIGPYLTAFGVIIGAGAAWVTYIFYYRNTAESNWLNTFRALYAEFWNTGGMAEVRKIISSEEEYTLIAVILTKRLSNEKNVLCSDENDVIENIDRFCALMFRVMYFGHRPMKPHQKKLYIAVFSHWSEAILNRHELVNYIAKYWTSLHNILTKGEI